MRKKILWAGLLTVAALGLTPIGGISANTLSVQRNPGAAQVTIDNFTFSPATLTVSVGTTVTWTNGDDIPHTVVSAGDPRAFKSNALDTGDKFSFTFTKAGSYPYFCSIHPKMTGRIVAK